MIIDTGASANPVGARWPNNQNTILRSLGRAEAKFTPASASFRSGYGHVGIAHKAAIVPIAITDRTGHFMAYVADADIPALLGKEELETLSAHLDFRRRVLTVETLGADIPLRMNAVGHCILNVADFPGSVYDFPPRCKRRAGGSAPTERCDALFLSESTQKETMRPPGRGRPPLTLNCFQKKPFAEEGLHLGGKISPPLRMDRIASRPDSDTADCPNHAACDNLSCGHRDDLPIHTALTSTTLGTASDGENGDPAEIPRKLHANWGRASPQHLKRTLAEADGEAVSLILFADDVVRRCDVCRVLHVAPSIPASSFSSVASISEKVQRNLLFLDDFIVLRALDLLSRYSSLAPVRSKNPGEVWGAFRTSRIAVFAKPRSIQMDEGGEWKNELWADSRADRYIRLQLRGVGAHPWISERRNGLA